MGMPPKTLVLEACHTDGTSLPITDSKEDWDNPAYVEPTRKRTTDVDSAEKMPWKSSQQHRSHWCAFSSAEEVLPKT